MALAICTPIPVVETKIGPRLAPITVEWHRARQALAMPTNMSWAELRADGYPVDQARNLAAQHCLDSPTPIEYLFFLDYDVLPPPQALTHLVYQAKNHPECDIFFGPYCVKSDPPEPLIYSGYGNGAYWDWTLGDVLIDEIKGVGMGCTLVRTSLFARLPHSDEQPRFKTVNEQCLGPDGTLKRTGTEDLWFCQRIVEELGARILVDTGIQCGHINNETGMIYGLPADSLPARRAKERQNA
jgi:hypothetical protein